MKGRDNPLGPDGSSSMLSVPASTSSALGVLNGSYWNDPTLPLVGAWLEDMRRTLPPIVLGLGTKVLGLCKNWKMWRERKGSPGYRVMLI